MKRPNLFTHATSELSQDAFFCWLFQWANDDLAAENAALQKASKDFLIGILPERITMDYSIKEIKVDTQVAVTIDGKTPKNRIDFIVKINDEILLVFEDKTASTTSTSQLKPYHDYIDKKYSKFQGNIFFYYLKSDIVWDSEKKLVENNDYTVIDIFRIAELMPKSIGNAIYDDYVEIIKKRIELLKDYKSINPESWEKEHWLGFLVDFITKHGKGSVNKHYKGKHYWFWLSSHANCLENNCYVSLEFVAGKFAIKTVAKDGNPRLTKQINDVVREKVKETFKDYSGKLLNRNSKNTNTIFEFTDYFVINEDDLIDFNKSFDVITGIKEKFDNIEFK